MIFCIFVALIFGDHVVNGLGKDGNDTHLLANFNLMNIFVCKEPLWFKCREGPCISSSFRCDGHYDCPNEDDEMNCREYVPHHENTECNSDEFKCTLDGLCLPLEHVCDGQPQCIDKSDEILGCEQIKWKCEHGFLCKNGHCLANKKWLCDDHDDCGDGSDENNCRKL